MELRAGGARVLACAGHKHRMAPPNLTSKMLLDKGWGSKVRDFAKKTGLGFRSELIWNNERIKNSWKRVENLRQEFSNNTSREIYMVKQSYI
jgi:hypothetical protein